MTCLLCTNADQHSKTGAWFGDNERALCTSIIAVAGPVGIMMISVSAPLIVSVGADTVEERERNIPIINWATFGVCAVAAFYVCY